jgi:predicted TIM-barrel fold metal-dependent hydrolase
MIVDVHSHHFPRRLAARALRELTRRTGDSLQPSADGTLENQLDHMELSGVDRAVMCPVATKPSQHGVILRTACALRDGEFGERARRRIIPFASVHPADPDVIAHLREIAAAGIRGIKVHPYYQNFDLSDPAVWPLFREAADRGLIVQCHCGHDIGYPDRTDACGPREIAVLLRQVPDLVFIAAHLGGCRGFRPHATDALLASGCYLDTSALHRDWHGDEQMRLLRSWPTERLLFGTAFPWVHYPEALRWVRTYRAADDHAAVLGGNAARLLGL